MARRANIYLPPALKRKIDLIGPRLINVSAVCQKALERECGKHDINQLLRTGAWSMARAKHAGQLDKIGLPYFQHCLRVAESVRALGPEYEAAALLHDVVEDTDATLKDLRRFGPEVVAAVDALTRREGESWKTYIHRVAENRMAVTIKLADIRDNLLPWRMAVLRSLDPAKAIEVERMAQRALGWLEAGLTEKA